MNIYDLLSSCKCPDINGLYFENGDIAVLDCNAKSRSISPAFSIVCEKSRLRLDSFVVGATTLGKVDCSVCSEGHHESQEEPAGIGSV